MNLSTTPKHPPKRQETLGPMTPIQDWEVERATIIVERNEHREKAERLEKRLEKERQTYEKNTASLLREVKLKESFMEKKLKDVEEQLMDQILQMQRKLDDEKLSRQEEIQSIRHQHELVLESEDKKYQRRLTSLQERLKEYAELFEKEKLPEMSSDHDQEKDKLIDNLKLELAKQKEANAQLQETINNATFKENESEEFSSLQAFCKELQEKFETSESQLMDYRQQRNDYIQRVHQLENDLAAAHKQSQLHKKRLDQTVLSHDARIMEFISEAQRSEMTYQAQLQNMQSEHTELMRELREQHDTEREVWHIQQKTLIDEVRRDLNFEKEEALRELNREWKDKSEDLQASMSKDAMEIQTHWESKLEKAKSKSAMKMSRLQGEIEVVKDRLGKEIERRKQNQAGLAEAIEKIKALETKYITCQSKCQALLKQRTITEKEMITLHSQNRISYQLAMDLLSIASPGTQVDSQSSLTDILQTVIRTVSLMPIHEATDYIYKESSFDMGNIPYYSF